MLDGMPLQNVQFERNRMWNSSFVCGGKALLVVKAVRSWTREQRRRSPVRAHGLLVFEAGSRGHMVKRAEAAQAAAQQEVNKSGLAHTRAPTLVLFHSCVIAD